MEFLLIPALLYFIPAIIAIARRHHNAMAIFLTNLFLGWSVIGWIVALIWAFTSVERRDRAYY